MAQIVENLPTTQEPMVLSWVEKIPWRRKWQATEEFLLGEFHWTKKPGGSDGKASVCNVVELDLIPGLGRCPGEGNGNPFQYIAWENSMDRGAW